MNEALTNPFFLIVAGITLCSVIPAVANYWCKVRRHELDAALKHDMLARGMSADDIERVLSIKSSKSAVKELRDPVKA